MGIPLALIVNGEKVATEVDPSLSLLRFLREGLLLAGAKNGCEKGHCGACTVIVDGKAVDSCVMLAVQALGKEVLTVEGLAASGELDTLQQKFVEQGAVQCGFCTPGMLMSAKALLMANPLPSDQDIRTALAGNLCRCTGYKTIVAAVRAASGQESAAMEVPSEKDELLADLSVPGLAAPPPDLDAGAGPVPRPVPGPAPLPPSHEGGE